MLKYFGICQGAAVDNNRIKFIEDCIGLHFPHLYLELVKQCDGFVPDASDFEFFDNYTKKRKIDCVGSFLFLNPSEYSDFECEWRSPPEFFPEGLIAFAETGGGDLICFDYRNSKDNPDPEIVYWNHEGEVGKDVSFIAKNFEEFMSILKEPDDFNIDE